ncbi:MAG: ribonuclease HII, partial [Eubacterium sp.]|nr:ribonuclease HII [Eubacterium sp.]
MESIKEIKELFEQRNREQWQELFLQYESDSRAGVQKLITQYKNKIAAYQKEMQRLEAMLEFEKKYGTEYTCICGIDEAGRGPFAGPVVAGAVVLPVGLKLEGLNDSKQVSAGRREELFEEIKEKAVSYGI